MKTLVAFICFAAVASQAGAQVRAAAEPPDPVVSLRPFALAAAERLTAHNTFQAIFGQSVQPMWGGGVQLAFRGGLYVDIAATRLQKTGQRAFFFDGQSFQLGIADPVTLTPVEVTVGYRFISNRGAGATRVIPYVGAGAGSYSYVEKGDGTDVSEEFSARHTGYLFVGGAEFRVGRLVGVSGDVQYTRVPGILGTGGVSLDAGEHDLGGVAARVRLLVGH